MLAWPSPNESRIAEPRIAADQFADHHADHGERRADAKAREQRRHRGRKLDLPENLRARRLERAREIDQVGIDGAHRGQHVDHDREEHDQDRDQDFRIDRESHPQDEQRRERHLGRDLQRQDIGRQREFGGRRHAEHIADERRRAGCRAMKPDQHLGGGDAGMEGRLFTPHIRKNSFAHHRQRRHDEGRDSQQARSPFPGGEKHHQQDQACDRAAADQAGIVAHHADAFMPGRRSRDGRYRACPSGARYSRRPSDRCAAAAAASRFGMSILISSMMRPGRRLITSTRSDRITASSRSWVISSAVLLRVLQRLREIVLQHDAGLRVDRRERLVEQQHGRIDRERARQRHALAHAAGQLMRIVFGEIAELEGSAAVRAPFAGSARHRAFGSRCRTSRSARSCATAAAGPSAA